MTSYVGLQLKTIWPKGHKKCWYCTSFEFLSECKSS